MVYAFDPFSGEDASPGDFGLSVHPLSLRLPPGGRGGALVRTWTAKLGLPLALTLERLPRLVTARFTPEGIDAGEEGELELSVAEDAPERTHALTILGTGPDGRIARAYLSLTVR